MSDKPARPGRSRGRGERQYSQRERIDRMERQLQANPTTSRMIRAEMRDQQGFVIPVSPRRAIQQSTTSEFQGTRGSPRNRGERRNSPRGSKKQNERQLQGQGQRVHDTHIQNLDDIDLSRFEAIMDANQFPWLQFLPTNAYPQLSESNMSHVVVNPGDVGESPEEVKAVFEDKSTLKIFRRRGYVDEGKKAEMERKTKNLFTMCEHKVSKTMCERNIKITGEEYLWNSKHYGCIGSHSKTSDFEWHLTVEGPSGSPYENGVFFGIIKFPRIYPFEMPHVRFRTPIFHPEVDESGNLSLKRLKQEWSEQSTIILLFKHIENTLKCLKDIPFRPKDCYQPKIAELIASDYDEFEKIARQFTQMHALEY